MLPYGSIYQASGSRHMHMLDQRILGITLLLLLCLLVIVKRITTGSFLDKPGGSLQAVIADTYNLFFLLISVPAAAILMITGQVGIIEPIKLSADFSTFNISMEIAGIAFIVCGAILMAWALVRMGKNFQVGGSAPRTGDSMITGGPYGIIRHPMYAAALIIALGIACLIQSLVYLVIFIIYLVLIILIIPGEEQGLRLTYGEPYTSYRQYTKRLNPFLY